MLMKWSFFSLLLSCFVSSGEGSGVVEIYYMGGKIPGFYFRDFLQPVNKLLLLLLFSIMVILQCSVYKQKRQDFVPEILKELISTHTSLGGIAQELVVLIY